MDYAMRNRLRGACVKLAGAMQSKLSEILSQIKRHRYLRTFLSCHLPKAYPGPRAICVELWPS
jgi:hypothetical protein